jgi:hypothetical protein
MNRFASIVAAVLLVAFASTAMGAVGWCGNIWPNNGVSYTTLDNIDCYVQVWKEGVTDTVGQGAGIEAYLYYKCDTDVDFVEVDMYYNTDVGNNDEYTAQIPAGHGCSTVEYYIKVVDTTDMAECYGHDQADNPPNFFLPITTVTTQDVQVTFQLCISEGSTGGVCVTGSAPELTSWGQPGVAMGQPCPAVSPNLYEVTITFAAGSNPYVEYKYQKDDCSAWDCDPNHNFTIDDSSPTQTLAMDAWCWGTPDCVECGSPVEDTSWGTVKAIYR